MITFNGNQYDPFKVLGVPHNVTEENLKKAYRGLAKKYHPESGSTGNEEQMKLITLCYQDVKKQVKNFQKTNSNETLNTFGVLKRETIYNLTILINELQTIIVHNNSANIILENTSFYAQLNQVFHQYIEKLEGCAADLKVAQNELDLAKFHVNLLNVQTTFLPFFIDSLKSLLKSNLIFAYNSKEINELLSSLDNVNANNLSEWCLQNHTSLFEIIALDYQMKLEFINAQAAYIDFEHYEKMKPQLTKIYYSFIKAVNNALSLNSISLKEAYAEILNQYTKALANYSLDFMELVSIQEKNKKIKKR